VSLPCERFPSLIDALAHNLPGMPSYCAGLFNLRGRDVTNGAACNPVVVSYGFVTGKGRAFLLLNSGLVGTARHNARCESILWRFAPLHALAPFLRLTDSAAFICIDAAKVSPELAGHFRDCGVEARTLAFSLA
jgi:hypothetical protein